MWTVIILKARGFGLMQYAKEIDAMSAAGKAEKLDHIRSVIIYEPDGSMAYMSAGRMG